MDDERGRLVSNLNTCTQVFLSITYSFIDVVQELVNLLLTGVACSNVFDGNQVHADGRESVRGVLDYCREHGKWDV